MALLSRFFGRTASEGAAYAFGVATGPVLAPATEKIRQEAWGAHPDRLPGVGVLAEGVAQGQVDHDVAAGWAKSQGYDKDPFDALVNVANVGPGSAYAFELWRRQIIDKPAFQRALLRLGIEQEWIDDLVEIHDVLLTPDVLANARQQGFVDIDRQHHESELQGVSTDRADILFELSGNPPGPETLQRAANRGFIKKPEFVQGIREGRTKTKYTDLYWDLRVPILSAATAVRLYLKGWYTKGQRDLLGAEWGYTPQQMEDWYLSEGRPAAPQQMATAAARGIDGPDGKPMNETQFLKGIKESDIRPEWGPMLWGIRWAYPPLFQTVRLLSAGTIQEPTAREWLKNSRYPPDVIDAVVAGARGSAGTTADTHVAKAQTQLWTATHSSYLNREASATVARTKLAQAGVASASISQILGIWDQERELIRKGLTPANVKKAFAKGSRNNATGQPWTRDEALAFLVGLGWSANEANDYLDIP